MISIQELEQRVRKIEKRNGAVTADKAWETSWARRLSIAVLTYLVVASYLSAIGNEDPWINALVPAAGFLLSTMVMKSVKAIWIARRYKG